MTISETVTEEQVFREMYSERLHELKGERELEEERRRVRFQSMKTPGRRGEEIKEEEISKEMVRRYFDKR